MRQRWPARLWVVRHGQSAGNVARDLADQAAHDRIAVEGRDVDVPLSTLGERQARALGHWFADQPEMERPDVLLASPYARAQSTAALFRAQGGAAPDEPICSDERLREKEFGILDGLTTAGVMKLQPEQAEFRRMLGKFYHRPPGGESWCDVILRLRSLMDTVSLHYAERRVMIFAHQVVVLCLRYIVENMDEQRILTIDYEGDVANCAVTEYRFDPEAGKDGNLVLARYNFTVPMEEQAVPVTTDPEPAAGGAHLMGVATIDADWRKSHPLPVFDAGDDKNSRGRVLLVGGSEKVPGGVLLTGEAALRTGAGKIQIGTVRSVAIPLGVAFPEAGVIPLPADDQGEIAVSACEVLQQPGRLCDTLLLGPAMSGGPDNAALLHGLLAAPRDGLSVLLDAAAIVCAGKSADVIASHGGRVVLTPHHGEMAALTGLDAEEIAQRPEEVTGDVARHYNAVIALKSRRTVVAAPDGTLLHYRSDSAGLATAGSGDVLAGVIAALLARGADPVTATGWGVWLHGEAGKAAAVKFGPTGFLARDLLKLLPRLLAAHAPG